MVRLFRLCAFVLSTMVVTGSLAHGYREGELIVKFRSERAQTRGMAGVEGMGHVEAQRLMPLTGNKNAATRSAKQSLVPAFSTPTEDIDLSQLYLIRFDATSMTVEEAVKAQLSFRTDFYFRRRDEVSSRTTVCRTMEYGSHTYA